MEAAEARVAVEPTLLDDLHRLRGHHAPRLLAFVLLYLVGAIGVWWLVELGSESPWRWVVAVPLYVLAGASLHGISLFTHEAVHGTLSANTSINRWLGMACAWPVLQNYSAYRVLHLKHHLHLGKEGDPDHYANYTSWTWLEFTFHWLRLLIGYPVYLVAIPLLGFRQGNAADRRWVALDVTLLAACITLVWLSPLPGSLLLHGWLFPMLFINTMVNIRGMSQHTFLEHHSDPILGTRSIRTNRVTAYFMCNENYHLEHHLYPGVPWYNLHRLHDALLSQLTGRGAPVVPSYFAFVREFVTESVRRVRAVVR